MEIFCVAKKLVGFFLSLILILGQSYFVFSLFSSPKSVLAASTTLLISELQIDGGTATDEFIELFNAGSTNHDLNGHRLVYRSAAGTSDVTFVSWSSQTIIPPGRHYLITASGYDGSTVGDQGGVNQYMLATGGGVAIRNGEANTGTIVDSLGWGTATNVFVEGGPVPAPSSNQSLERKPGGNFGNGQDSDLNYLDFQILTSPTPKNLSSSATSQPTLISVTPSSVEAGKSNINVSLVGTNTHFLTSTTISFGGGVTVNLVSVQDATHLTVNVSVSPTATFGPRTINITTGSESVTKTGLFSVSAHDNIAPFIKSTWPVNGQVGIAPNIDNMSIVFSEALDQSTLISQNISLTSSTGNITLNFEFKIASNTLLVKLQSNLSPSTSYNLTLGAGIRDLSSNTLAYPYVVNFSTASTNDTSPPTILQSSISNGATGVAVGVGFIGIAFSEHMEETTLNTSNLTLTFGGNPVSGEIKYDSGLQVAYFVLNSALAINTSYTFTVGTGVKDIARNSLSSSQIITFTTGSTDTSVPTVLYAESSPFEIKVYFSEAVLAFDQTDYRYLNSVLNLANYTLYSPLTTGIGLIGLSLNYIPWEKAVVLSGLNLTAGNNFQIILTNIRDLSGNLMSSGSASGVVRSSSNMGLERPPDMAQMGLLPINVVPKNFLAEEVTNYTVSFPTTVSLPGSGKIILSFPAGFDLSAVSFPSSSESFLNSDINGGSSGTITIASVSGDNISKTVTITIGSAGGTQTKDFLNFELSGIKNGPAISFNSNLGTGGYVVGIATKNSTGATLEGPLNSLSFNILEKGARTISGQILDDMSTPADTSDDVGLNGVTVYLESPLLGQRKVTTQTTGGVAGSFSFTNLPAEQYSLFTEASFIISSQDYVGQTMPQTILISSQDVTEKILRVKRLGAGYYQIQGTITGPPDQKIIVWAANSTSYYSKKYTLVSSSPNNLDSDNNGTGDVSIYTLKVPPGTYKVGIKPQLAEGTVLPGGPSPSPVWMPPLPIEVKVESSNLTGKNFTLSTTSRRITGYVRDATNSDNLTNGLANVNVYAYIPADVGMGAAGKTILDGSFSLRVLPGTYTVGITGPGLPSVSEQTVTVPQSADPSSITFKVTKSSLIISGKVLKDQISLSYASVFAQKVDSSGNLSPGFITAISDTNGNYTLYVAQNTTWKIGAFAQNFGETGKITVSIINQSQTNKNLTVSENLGTVVGSVTYQGNGVLATIFAKNSSGEGNHALTDSSGNYTLKLTAGNYTLSVWSPDYGKLEEKEITVTAGQTQTQNFIIQNIGTVTVNFSSLVSEGFITLYSAQTKNGNSKKISNSSSGSLSLPYGTYKIFASVLGLGSFNQDITFTSAQPTQTINFTLPSQVTISGQVKDLSGNGLSEATVTVISSGGISQKTKTNSSGDYSVTIASGQTYFLSAQKTNYLSGAPTKITVGTANLSGQGLILTGQSSLGRITGTVYKGSVSSSNKASQDATVWAVTRDGKWAGTKTDESGNYSLSVGTGTWYLEGATDGYYTAPNERLEVAISGTETVLGKNIVLAQNSGLSIKPPKTASLTPSAGGVVEDSNNNLRLTIPANALGSSSMQSSLVSRQTASVFSTGLARPIGGRGFEISAQTGSGQAITNLENEAEIEVDYSQDLASGRISSSDISKLKLGYWDETLGNWVFLSATNDTGNKKLKGTTSHFSTFAALLPTGVGPASTPTGLTVANPGTGEALNLSWSVNASSEEVTSYKIYRSTQNSSFSYLGLSTSASYQDTTVSRNTTYYYKISAVNSYGESAQTSSVSGTSQDTTAPSAPSNVAISAGSSKLSLSWTNPGESDFSYVRIYRSTTQGSLGSLMATNLTGTSYEDTGLTNDTIYYYTLRSVDTSDNESENTTQYSGTPKAVSSSSSSSSSSSPTSSSSSSNTVSSTSGGTSTQTTILKTAQKIAEEALGQKIEEFFKTKEPQKPNQVLGQKEKVAKPTPLFWLLAALAGIIVLGLTYTTYRTYRTHKR